MSLLEALLTEGYRDPHEVYISLRTDGQKGSGTITDPYDGTTRLGPELSSTLICNRREFVVGTRFSHGLSVGNLVTITGASGPGADWFNGADFEVKEIVSPLHFILEFDSGDTGLPPAPPGVPYSYLPLIEVLFPGGAKDSVRIYWPVAKVTLPAGHGLNVFDGVAIGGISPADYAGDYPILGPKSSNDTIFAYRLSFLPGADVTTPISCTVKRRIYRFDEVVRSVPSYSVIHIGPGTFETRGAAPMYVADLYDWTQLHAGYVIRPGQRLLGSGIGASILKLVLPLDESNQTAAIANFSNSLPTNADYVEVADLTVDCNAPEQAAPFGIFPAPVTCGAVALQGSFIRLQRVRAINYCTQGRAECFGLYCAPGIGPLPAFNVIEDCIMEKPGTNNTHETSQLGIFGDYYGGGRSFIVRHNYVNSGYGNGVSSEAVAISGISYNTDGTATITTLRPHNRTGPDPLTGKLTSSVLIVGVWHYVNGKPVGTPFNAPFPVAEYVSATQFKIVRPANVPAEDDLEYYEFGFRAHIGVSFHGPTALSGTGSVSEGNALYDCVRALYTDTGSIRDVVVRDNYYSNVGLGIDINFPPDSFDAFRGASAIVPENAPEDSGYKHGVFTTIQPHGLSVNDTVTIREAGEANSQTGNPYHGSGLLVKVIRSANQFVYRLASQSAPLPTDNCAGRPVFKSAVAISSSTGSLSYTSSNLQVTVTTSAAHNLENGDFVTLFGTVLESPPPTNLPTFDGFMGPVTLVSATQFFFQRDMGSSNLSAHGGSTDRHMAAGMTRSGSVVTVETASPLGYYLNQVIRVQNAFIDGTKSNRYNGVVTIKPLTDKSFSYEMKPGSEPDPTLSKSPTGLAEYAAHWDIRHLVLENNVYDLYATDTSTAIFPRAVSMFGLNATDIPPYLFPVFIYRENIIRHIDERLPSGTLQPSYGIFATTIGGGIVEQNVIDASAAAPLTYQSFGQISHLENKTSGGLSIHGAKLNPGQSTQPIDDLEARIQDALTMSLL